MLQPLAKSRWSRRAADHLMSRTSCGGSPQERDALYRLGRDRGVAAAVESVVNRAADWRRFTPPRTRLPFPDEPAYVYHREHQRDFVGWYVRQLTEGPPLAARMFKFWVDHFPIDQGAIHPKEAIYPFFQKHFVTLRDGAIGRFDQLLQRVTWSPGMMRMLDLQASSRSFLNENFARELLELFTVGVQAGYTEQDVATLAAVFTGRAIRGPYPYEAYLDETVYTSGALAGEYRRIDPTEKTLLTVPDPANPAVRRPGRLHAIRKPAEQRPGDPREQGNAALAILLAQPEAGQHLAWKLWRYFVSPDPAQALTAELGRRWKSDYGWETKPLLRDLFLSEEFYAEEVIGDQIKDPCDLLVSASRVLGLPSLPRSAATLALGSLGQNVFSPPSIAGWPEPSGPGNGWVGAGPLFNRMVLGSLWAAGDVKILRSASTIPAGELPLPEPDLEVLAPPELRGSDQLPLLIRHLADRLFPAHPLEDEEIRELLRHATRERIGYSEDQMLRELVQALLAMPQFQMQ